MVDFYKFPVSFDRVFENKGQITENCVLKNLLSPRSLKSSYRPAFSPSLPVNPFSSMFSVAKEFVRSIGSTNKQPLFSNTRCFVLTTANNRVLNLKSSSTSPGFDLCPLFFSKDSALRYLATLEFQNSTFASSFDLRVCPISLDKVVSNLSSFLPISETLDNSSNFEDDYLDVIGCSEKSLLFPVYAVSKSKNLPNVSLKDFFKDAHLFLTRSQVKSFLDSESGKGQYHIHVCELEDVFNSFKVLSRDTLSSVAVDFNSSSSDHSILTPSSFRFLGIHFGTQEFDVGPFWRVYWAENLRRIWTYLALTRELVGQFHLSNWADFSS